MTAVERGRVRAVLLRAALVVVMLGCVTAERLARAAPRDDDTGDERELVEPAARIAAPPIAGVLAAAYRAAGMDRDPSRGWIRRARIAGLIPWLTVRAGRDSSWQDLDPDVDRGATLEVRASWRLDRLLFDGRELQVASIEAARRRERRRLASRVVRDYFAWRRAASTAAVASPEQHRARARAEEAAAELDALTDGWFSDELARLASGRRTR